MNTDEEPGGFEVCVLVILVALLLLLAGYIADMAGWVDLSRLV